MLAVFVWTLRDAIGLGLLVLWSLILLLIWLSKLLDWRKQKRTRRNKDQ